ncbi:MAG TPA: hypothetical protein VGQ46_15855 [Thermoanaerobaculia bacterium]|jgi:hypothetical protein|nr:hypothetical protein [Thermoanaerobaculia bacterium]
MRKPALLLTLLALIPISASAFNPTDLLSLVAMPLAVDAASRVTGVPQDQLAQLVSSLNQANVPPQQFVQTVRYAPVALQQPDFVPYVQTQQSQGINGVQLVDLIDQRLPQYGVQEVEVIDPTPSYVLSDNYIYSPTSIGSNSNNLLSLIAMPLAVAALSEIAGVPQDQLASLLGTLNRANVPPAQFVDTLRYVPVALVEQPDFVPYVQSQVSNGVTGPALVTVIDQRLPQYTPAPAPSNIVVTQDYIPPTVRTRVAEWHNHPHGGPPGQLKKMDGFQTGAQVVHRDEVRQFQPPPVAYIPPGQAKKEERRAEGEGRGHGHGKHEREQAPVFVQQPMTSAVPPPQPVFVPAPQQEQEKDHGHGRGPGGEGPPGQQKEKGGKGHGKD